MQARNRVVSFCETEFNGDVASPIAFFKSDLQHENAVTVASKPVDVLASYQVNSTREH